MNQYCGISRKNCAICDNVGDRQEHWRILFIFCVVESVVGDDGTEVVRATSIVERNAHGDRHVLRVPHVLG